VIGHLVRCERSDWIPRAKIILEHGEAHPFDPLDRFAQLEESQGKTLVDLLEEFAALREGSLATLRETKLGAGEHDLDHIGQIARTMAKQYSTEVGPGQAYPSILHGRKK
jgi:uncharacterized protein YfbU (UPF0304 family)